MIKLGIVTASARIMTTEKIDILSIVVIVDGSARIVDEFLVGE